MGERRPQPRWQLYLCMRKWTVNALLLDACCTQWFGGKRHAHLAQSSSICINKQYLCLPPVSGHAQLEYLWRDGIVSLQKHTQVRQTSRNVFSDPQGIRSAPNQNLHTFTMTQKKNGSLATASNSQQMQTWLVSKDHNNINRPSMLFFSIVFRKLHLFSDKISCWFFIFFLLTAFSSSSLSISKIWMDERLPRIPISPHCQAPLWGHPMTGTFIKAWFETPFNC